MLPPATIVLYEHVILSIVLLPVLWTNRGEWRALGRREWAAIIGIAWGGSALATVAFTQAIRLGNPTSAVLLQKSQPLFAAVLAAALLDERLGRRYWTYLAVGLFAAYLVSFGDRDLRTPFAEPAPTEAALLALTAALLWGSSTVFGRYVSPKLSFTTLTALRIVVALPLLVALAGRSAPSAEHWPPLLALALLPGLAALLIYYRGLRGTPASLAAIAELAFPATAVLLNWIFLDARVTVVQLIGFAMLWGVIGHAQRARA